MRFGLPDKILQAILNELNKHEGIKKAILFGSRARGDYKHNSDIDLVIDCKGKLPLGLYGNLDEAAGIYKIDVLEMRSITNEKMMKNIEQEGVIIYPTTADERCSPLPCTTLRTRNARPYNV